MSLNIHDLAFSRNHEILFRNIHCTLSLGECLEVRGANGSGKSTFLRIIASLIMPETGVIQWMGKNISQQDDYPGQISYLGHQNGIKPYLTVYENLKLNCALTHKKIPGNTLIQILNQLNLAEVQNTPAIYLSAGQTRRLALSRLYLTDARLWILDEPTTSLDSFGQNLLTDLLTQHLTQDGIAIIATHHDLSLKNSRKTLHLQEAAHV
ncbi:MAG TPA: cytochrome c biogenesis heme-transporting ATPase CcmA [Gammaproteobacteria bacterium]|nr:cytochrome c biogenesis heme-transporting ATPase CcmA [Gammaproteobacteria bacterium]